MTPLIQGLIAGTAFGIIAVAAMSFMTFPDKRTALLGAFTSRFGIGLVIPLLNVSQPGWLVGAGVGLLLSLPVAIVTKGYAPVLGFGVVGGSIIGALTHCGCCA
jgi:hypothetical protein